MSTKVRAVTTTLLKEQFKLLAQSFGAVILIFVCLPLLYNLMVGNIAHYNFLGNISDLGLGFIFAIMLFIGSALTYDDFKLLIQNGIARKTYWVSRVYTVVIVSLVGELIAALYYYLVTAPVRGMEPDQAVLKTLFGLYGRSMGSNVFLNILAGMVFTWIYYVGVGLTGMAVGSLLALFNKWTQRLLVMVVPVVGVFLLGFVISSNQNTISQTFQSEAFANFLKFLAGYPAHGEALAGQLNPTMPTIIMLIGCVLMGGLAYLFYQRLHVKN